MSTPAEPTPVAVSRIPLLDADTNRFSDEYAPPSVGQDAEAAATARAAAVTARQGAEAAKAAVDTAAGQAATAATTATGAASTATTAAGTAFSAATAAGTSAGTASTAATTATGAATTATGAATAAGTARDGAVSARTAAETARDQAQAAAASKGQANGIAGLGSDAKILESQMLDRLSEQALLGTFAPVSVKETIDTGRLSTDGIESSTDGWLTQVFTGWNEITYGHSFLAEQGLSDATQYWARKLATFFGTVYPTSSGGSANDLKRAVGGSLAEDAAKRALGGAPFAPGTRALVIVQALINSARLHGDVAIDKTTALNALRSMMAAFNAASREEQNSASFTYSASGWVKDQSSPGERSGGSYSYTSTVGAYVDIDVPARDSYVIFDGKNASTGPTITVTDMTNGGETVGSFSLANQCVSSSNFVPYAYRVPTNRRGHKLRFTYTSGTTSFNVDVLLPQTPAPQPVLMMKEPYLVDYSASTMFPNGSDAALAAFNVLIDTVAAEFPNVIVADPNTAGYWTKDATLLQADKVHPSAKGNLALARTARDALKGYALRRAIVFQAPTDFEAPTVPAGLTATPGAGQVTLSWSPSTDSTGVAGYRIYQGGSLVATVTGTTRIITGLTGGTTYSFTVSAFDAAGNESARSTAATATPTAAPTVYARDSFDRADNSSPGSTEVGSLPWTAFPSSDLASWSIASNRLIKAETAALTAPKVLVVNTGQADGTIKATLFSALGAAQGVAFRAAADGTTGYLVRREADGSYRLFRWTGSSTLTTIFQTATGIGGQGDVVEVVLNGSSIKVRVNGTEVITQTHTGDTASTRHGVYAFGTAATSFEDFSHTSATT